MPRPFSFEVHARELSGHGDDWHVSRMEWVKTSKGLMAQLDGLCCPDKKTGDWKGHPNFKKGDKSTEKRVVIFADEHDAWCEAHEAKTGVCTECMGDGKRAVRSSKDGTEWGDCRRCGGSGKRGKNDE